jgi:hypothetical protein
LNTSLGGGEKELLGTKVCVQQRPNQHFDDSPACWSKNAAPGLLFPIECLFNGSSGSIQHRNYNIFFTLSTQFESIDFDRSEIKLALFIGLYFYARSSITNEKDT